MLLCLCLWVTHINSRFSPLPPVFFLFVIIFLRHWKLFSVLAVLLLCFLLCCFGGAVVFFLLFVLFFLLLKLKNTLVGYCVFLLRYECCFCCLLGPVCGVAFFSWCPSVVMSVQQCPPCVLPCPTSPTFRFPPFHNTHMHPSNPCARPCTLFTRSHMVMPVLVFVLVFVCLLCALCVCACLCVRLLVCLCLCFVFTYVYSIVLCAYGCVCICISCLTVCLRMCVFCQKYVYFCNIHVLINYIFIIFNHSLINITHLGPIALV